eukprot:3241413-Rhodomonas_salina.1
MSRRPLPTTGLEAPVSTLVTEMSFSASNSALARRAGIPKAGLCHEHTPCQSVPGIPQQARQQRKKTACVARRGRRDAAKRVEGETDAAVFPRRNAWEGETLNAVQISRLRMATTGGTRH